MNAEQRREAIIAATLPLLREAGPDVTTSQIARAAGIAEGTIFRVFEDKRELLLAAICTAMSADAEVARIHQIPLNAPIAQRLVAALAATSDYQDRLWSLIRHFRELRWRPESAADESREHRPRQEMGRIGAAIARLFAPEGRALRHESGICARLLLGLAFASRIQEPDAGEPPLSPEQLVELFLDGALNRQAQTRA